MSQIMNLLKLASDTLQEILFLPRVESRKESVTERGVLREVDLGEAAEIVAIDPVSL